MKNAKDKSFADPIIKYLMGRCEEDKGLSEDILQKHKTWEKCLSYVYSLARKQANGNCAAVRDEVVYEWAEDYYHKDDKAEEAEKAKKAEEATGFKIDTHEIVFHGECKECRKDNKEGEQNNG